MQLFELLRQELRLGVVGDRLLPSDVELDHGSVPRRLMRRLNGQRQHRRGPLFDHGLGLQGIQFGLEIGNQLRQELGFASLIGNLIGQRGDFLGNRRQRLFGLSFCGVERFHVGSRLDLPKPKLNRLFRFLRDSCFPLLD